MRVVTDNRSGWSLQVECTVCKSVLEIVDADVAIGSFGMAGHYDREFFVHCPLCAADVVVSRQIPEHVKRAVRSRSGS